MRSSVGVGQGGHRLRVSAGAARRGGRSQRSDGPVGFMYAFPRTLGPRSSGDRAPPSGGGSVGSNPTGGTVSTRSRYFCPQMSLFGARAELSCCGGARLQSRHSGVTMSLRPSPRLARRPGRRPVATLAALAVAASGAAALAGAPIAGRTTTDRHRLRVRRHRVRDHGEVRRRRSAVGSQRVLLRDLHPQAQPDRRRDAVGAVAAERRAEHPGGRAEQLEPQLPRPRQQRRGGHHERQQDRPRSPRQRRHAAARHGGPRHQVHRLGHAARRACARSTRSPPDGCNWSTCPRARSTARRWATSTTRSTGASRRCSPPWPRTTSRSRSPAWGPWPPASTVGPKVTRSPRPAR